MMTVVGTQLGNSIFCGSTRVDVASSFVSWLQNLHGIPSQRRMNAKSFKFLYI